MVRQKAFAGKLLTCSLAIMIICLLYNDNVYAFDKVTEDMPARLLHANMSSSYSNNQFHIPPHSDDSTELYYYYSLNNYEFGTDVGKISIHSSGIPELRVNQTSGSLISFVYTYEINLVAGGVKYPLSANYTYGTSATVYPYWQSAVIDKWNGYEYLEYKVHLTYTNMDSESVLAAFDLYVPSMFIQIDYLGYDSNVNNQLDDMESAIVQEFNDEQALISESNKLQEQANELQEESNETQKNIFEKITDFFNNFFSRLGELLLSLIVPSAEDLTAFLDEVNEWFSDRLGFIWYPFGFAVDAVSALAGGDANTQFTVPALQINMLGGTYTIWNEMSVDIDSFDIFKYVRLFTSFICVGGIVSLAYNKWDEWIGGHGVG